MGLGRLPLARGHLMDAYNLRCCNPQGWEALVQICSSPIMPGDVSATRAEFLSVCFWCVCVWVSGKTCRRKGCRR